MFPRLIPKPSPQARSLAEVTAATTAISFALALSLPVTARAADLTFSSPTNTGAAYAFVVPAGVTSIHVEAVGGKGGDRPSATVEGISYPDRTGGFGATVTANLAVVPGQKLYVYVGGNGEGPKFPGPSVGGANGGGNSGAPEAVDGEATGGGGASDIRMIEAPSSGDQEASLHSRVLVAAGGGGAAPGLYGDGDGGAAGKPGTAVYTPAQPGTTNPEGSGAGGAGGTAPWNNGEGGTLGNGGAGGGPDRTPGGGGGGGLYGGGGGAGFFGQSGAGGASWVEPSGTDASTDKIDTTGHPRVTISFPSEETVPAEHLPPPPSPPVLSALHAVRPCVTSAALGQPQAGSHGLAFSFSLSESAHVTFTVMHHVESPAWASCTEAQRNHGHKPGTYRTVSEVSHPVPAGLQTVSIGTAAGAPHTQALAPFGPGQHRISLAGIATEHLHPGTYTLLVTAVNATGQTSGLSRIHFWVVR